LIDLAPRRLLQAPIHLWRRLFAPILPPMCRFYPSCSAYALQAIEEQPIPRALWLIARRLARCQPFCAGGYDPPPPPSPKVHG
jgi:hypothetical protein